MGLSSRVLLSLVAITAAGFLLAAGVALWLQARSVDARVDRSLSHAVAELRTLATEVDPASGKPFASVEALLSTSLSRSVPNRHEGLLVTVDGRVPFVSGFDTDTALEDVPELRRIMSALPADASAQLGTLHSAGHELRYVVVPVQVAGDPARGVFASAIDLTAERSEVEASARAYAVAGLITLLLIGSLGTLILRRQLRPLRRLAETARRISEEDLSERIPEEGADDLARLTHTVNGMLDRLESSFRGQRALLDDVGHELRTPLTIIRGHLEIMDAGDPRDVDETRVLALDELDRMGRLVDELVLLAKSERPDFLSVQDVAVDGIVEGALERARALADRRWSVDAECGASIVGDKHRLMQALLQLVSNAVRHTDPGDEIAVGASLDAGTLRLWVRDTGEGVPAADQARIFNRFERGSSDRNRGPGGHGSGLGLTIVSAIAAAHGGRVVLSSLPGAGATFALELPGPTAGSVPR